MAQHREELSCLTKPKANRKKEIRSKKKYMIEKLKNQEKKSMILGAGSWKKLTKLLNF